MSADSVSKRRPQVDTESQLQAQDGGGIGPALAAEKVADGAVVESGVEGDASYAAIADGFAQVDGEKAYAVDHRVDEWLVGPGVGPVVRGLASHSAHGHHPIDRADGSHRGLQAEEISDSEMCLSDAHAVSRVYSDAPMRPHPSAVVESVPLQSRNSSYAGFYQQHVKRLGHTMTRDIAKYRPDPSRIPEEDWEPIRAFVRDVMAKTCKPGEKGAGAFLGYIAYFVHYWVNIHGYPLDATVLFDPPMVIAFQSATNDGTVTEGTLQNRRARLMRACEAMNPDRVVRMPSARRKDAIAPYDDRELGRLHNAVSGLASDYQRRNGKLMTAFCLGAGLCPGDLRYLSAADVEISDTGIIINAVGNKNDSRSSIAARRVAVFPDWEDDIRDLTRGIKPDEFLIMSNVRQRNRYSLISGFADGLELAGGLRFSTQRLRVTWICRHLALGTPPYILREAAGLRNLDSFNRYLQFVDLPDWDTQVRFMQGRGWTA